MANTFRQVFDFIAKTSNFERGTRKVEGGLQGVGRTLGRMAGAVGLAFGANEVLNFAKDATAAATAAEEMSSKFEAVLGTGEAAAEAVDRFADRTGTATAESKDLFATLANMTQAQGMSRQESLDFAVAIGDLAGDLASFHNENPEEVFYKLSTAMTSAEREAVKPLVGAISETEVKQRALNRAMADGRDEATKADRAYASFEIAMQQSGTAIGDLDRTMDSAANRARRVNGRLEDLKVTLGQKLLPLQDDMLSFADALLTMADSSEQLEDRLMALPGALSAVESYLSRTLPGWNDVQGAMSSLLDEYENRVPLLGDIAGYLRDVNDELTGHADEVRETEEAWRNAVTTGGGDFVRHLKGLAEDVLPDTKGEVDELIGSLQGLESELAKDWPSKWARAFPFASISLRTGDLRRQMAGVETGLQREWGRGGTNDAGAEDRRTGNGGVQE